MPDWKFKQIHHIEGDQRAVIHRPVIVEIGHRMLLVAARQQHVDRGDDGALFAPPSLSKKSRAGISPRKGEVTVPSSANSDLMVA